jgi:hypothetical protein
METADPREPAAASSTTLATKDGSNSPEKRHGQNSTERWNWWILNHGLLIGSALIAFAFVTLGLRFASDHRGGQTKPATTTRQPGANTVGLPIPTTARLTTIGSQVLAQTVAPTVVSTPPPQSAASPSSTVAATTTPAPTLAATTAQAAPTTIADTTTQAITTTQATTTTQAATTTELPLSVADAAKQLPHLQLGGVPVTWVQVSRRVTSRHDSRPPEPALSFRWVGPQRDTGVLLQIAASSTIASSTETQTIRGHEAAVITNGSDISIQWIELPGVVVSITVHGFAESDAVTFGNNLIVVSDAEWVRLVGRSKVVIPPSWDRVLLEDW